MGMTAGALGLPMRRISGKELERMDRGDGFEELCIPWFDEEALTLALDAGLALGDLVERADHVVLALEEPHEQVGLVQYALGLEAPVSTRYGALSGIKALASWADEAVLVLSGGAGVGGAGVAVLLEPGKGVPVVGVEQAHDAPLASHAGSALERVARALHGEGPLRVPAGVTGTGAAGERSSVARTARIGEAGPAGALVEAVDALSDGGPVRVVASGNGEAWGVQLGEGRIDAVESPEEGIEVGTEAWDRLRGANPVPWSEASQGAYVSRADFEADPVARYGARTLGRARVEAVTTVRGGPPGEFVRQHEAAGPYDVVVVGDDGRERWIHQSAAPAGMLSIGDEVERVVRRLFSLEGRWRYGVKVRPA